MAGSVAARSMGWQRRMGSSAGPLGASGEATNGNPVQAELLINGVWTDITAYVMVRDESGNIALTSGQRDEGSQTEQMTGQLLLNNRDGRFSPRNPMSPYYGLIGRNSTLRISVPNGIGGKVYRFWGEISSWPQSWDPTGTDVWVELDANGPMRRLSQGPAPTHSVIYRAIANPLSSSVVAYWPCEDASDATSLASALISGSAMRFSGTPTLATYDGFKASDPLPDISAASLNGGVTNYADPTATQVRFLCFIPSDGLTDGKVICSIDQLDYSAGATQFWELYYTTTGNTLVLRTCASDGTNLGAYLTHTLDVRGRQMYISVEFQENGTGITRAVRIIDVNSTIEYDATDTATLTSLTRVHHVQMGPTSRSAVGPLGTRGLPGVAVGHITVENAISAMTSLGVRLNTRGETAGRRIQRICSEEGIAFDWVGDLDDTSAMGDQTKLNPLSVMQECELADAGMLHENFANLGLVYRTRSSLYNQDPALTLDYAAYNLSDVPTPVEDDRYIQNQVTVTVNDVSQTYSLDDGSFLSVSLPPTGVGVYGTDVTLNLDDTSSTTLGDQAAWRVHMGTVDEPRYPSISVNLAHSTFVSNPTLKQAVLALRQGDRIRISNPPSWLPPGSIDQIVIGMNETITHFEHRIEFVCAPSSPYTVGFVESSIARLDTDGSILASAATSSDTTLSVTTTTGPIWTFDPADAPFHLRVGGEVVTATVIGSVLNSNPDFETDLSAWGTTNGTLTRTDGTAKFGTWSGLLTAGAGTDPRAESGTWPVTVGAQYRASAWLHAPQVLTTVEILCYWFDAGASFLSSSSAIAGTPTVGVWESWSGVVTAPASAVTASILFQMTGTPGAGLMVYADRVTLVPVTSYSTSPQTLTVTRSVNGIVKAHSAGEDIRLSTPTFLSA